MSAGRPRGFLPSWKPQAKTEALLAQVERVLLEYVSYLPLTCRQIFYRLVGAHRYDKTEQAYDRLCEALNKARRAHLIPFEHIRDDDAPLPEMLDVEDEAEVVGNLRWNARHFRLDRQAYNVPRPFVAVLCEAKGMVPQLERIARPFSVPVLGSGGFDSTTFKHGLAERAAEMERPLEVLHIGDHDPSGVHVFSNLAEDVGAFAEAMGADVLFSRLAVIPAQILAWNLPTAPRKATDRRRFQGVGDDPEATVQAEAVPPDVMAALLRGALADRVSPAVGAAAAKDEAALRARLTTILAGILPESLGDGPQP